MPVKNTPPAGIIIATHGHLGEALIRSTKMIFGEFDRVTAVSLEEGMSPEEYYQRLKKACIEYRSSVLILADLFGGTPCRVSAMLAREIELNLITGVNMAMLIEALQSREALEGQELADALVNDTKESIQDVTVELNDL
ncbi:PTS sugar transporter subunit IIA [Lachnospiraceae bacterium 62-35]